ncbi:MAG: hypothetical protein JXJ04_17560 [Spirochaetales bacterium]|nr:hypothetical protein [Spirochaetales bacterium]
MKKVIIIFLLSTLLFQAFAEEITVNEAIKLRFGYEKGTLKFLHHTIQIGDGGTDFNYIEQGGQEILFPFERFTADLFLFKNNRLSFLYQPLTIETTTKFYDDVIIDDVTFAAGTIVNMKYGFPFYRVTYSYQFHPLSNLEIGTGLAFQLRNASITFASADGVNATSSQNVGPVPALHVNCLYSFLPGVYVYFEATGLYASSAIINGADFEFEGSILDTSLRFGAMITKNMTTYLNVRFLGGSAKGTSEYSNDRWSESRERYTSNYLAFSTISLGIELIPY